MFNSGAIWIVAAFVGFLVYWPIGVAFLVTIFATAVSQQLIGYRPRHHYIGGSIDPPMKQINQIEVKAITDRTRR